MRLRILPLVLLMVLLFPYGHLSAQDDSDYVEPPKLFEGRLICGFNFTQVDGDTYAGYHKVGLNTGGMVYVHFTPLFGVSMELLYAQKGTRGGHVKESYAWGTYIDKYYLNLNYAEAALMLHCDMHYIDFEAGLSYSRLVKSDEWAESDVPIVVPLYLCRFNDQDISYVAGFSIKLGKRWYTNMRYQYSSKAIRPRERVLPRYSDGSGQYNEVVSLRLLYTLKS